MFTSLRARLWVTYAIIILLILSILGVGTFVYIIRNPIIDRQAIQKLNLSLGLIQRQTKNLNINLGRNPDYLNRISDSLSIRLILMDADWRVIYDTDPESSGFDWPVDKKTPDLQGRVNDQEGKTWLFESWKTPNGFQLILTVPRQGGIQLLRSPQLRQMLRDDFLPTFFRTGLIAFFLAIIFAIWLGNWIANPLKRIETASRGLSSSEFVEIPLKGPDEVQALAGAYNEMVNRVQATQQSQRDFVANVSHELKTPLTSIQGFSQAILDGAVDSGDALRKAATIIKIESDRMYRLVVDLLDLARFDAGTLALERKALNVKAMLNHVTNQLIPQAAEAQVHLTLEVDTLPTFVGDQDRLAQVFTNLIDNAIKHTPQDGIVQVDAWYEAGHMRIQVRDSGEGIEDEHLSRIFERFYKIDKSRKKDGEPGTGLGLAIAKQIIEMHGGNISVSSTIGVGTIFEVMLPVVKPDDSTVSVAREEPFLS
jgi:signal transduction histidine kinase